MRIGLIAPPWVPVPPPAYGGTEIVVDRLARGLVAAGHEVRLYTVGESTCAVPRLWRYPKAMEPLENSVIEAAHVLAAYESMTDVDLIHDHTVIGPLLARRRRRQAPVVATIHSAFTADYRLIYKEAATVVPLVCISHDQRSGAPEVPVARVIHHGIDPDAFPFGAGDGGYLLFLGRMSPDKGVDRAICVARAAGRPLLIAAKMREAAEVAYFEEQVEPMLGGDVEYLGEVDAAGRLALLQGARALVNPIQWPEPFGLVMIEALATGTPVISSPRGAAPEIVEDGRTGFLCAGVDEMVRAVGRVDSLRRLDCRHAAVARFSTGRMVRDHIAFYSDVLAGHGPGSPARPGVDLDLARSA